MKKQERNDKTESPAFRRGKKVREQVLGVEHVARATSAQTDLDADFQTFITEVAWGSVWAREGLDLRTRHLITIGILAALGREHELTLHLASIRNTGTSWHDVQETLLHVAVYAGIPAANSAMAVAKKLAATESAREVANA